MKPIYDEVNTLDKKCYEKYFLSEDILMEHAALAMFNYISKTFTKDKTILIVCGSGNNGADGIVLARLLYKIYNIKLYIYKKPKSKIASLQEKRTLSLGVNLISNLKDEKPDIIADCLFGTGLNRKLNITTTQLIEQINNLNSYIISCDIASGINTNGQILTKAIKANTTITMGALKKSLFSDNVKDYIGDIIISSLGIHNSLYENKTNTFLLEQKDLLLPLREEKNTNKGTFGHLAVLLGDKIGAGIIACETALSFGCGLVSAITNKQNLPYSIMYNKTIPSKTTAIALGMGLGDKLDKSILNTNLPLLLDADIFYNTIILDLLKKDNIVLTPHPKEFCSLLKITKIDDIDIKTLQDNRFYYVNKFCNKYPNVVLLLKGANVIICKNNLTYINNNGTNKLSFAGSGDVLAGLIASLLAQGYNCLDATIQGSLAHTQASSNFKGNDYSLNPKDLIEEIKIL